MLVNLTGQKIGMLTVLEEAKRQGYRRFWMCSCECGQITTVRHDALKMGHTISCGCIRIEKVANAARRHGMSESSEYNCWESMISRCNNPKTPHYDRYGGRGIQVCPEWTGEQGFINFYKHMGARPSNGHSIERNNVNGNYEPSNCRWATQQEQMNNTSKNRFFYHNGETLTVAQWARRRSIDKSTLYNRLVRLKWNIEKALNTPVHKRRSRTHAP